MAIQLIDNPKLYFDSTSDEQLVNHLLTEGMAEELKYVNHYLHIFGIRNSNEVNKFDDYIGVVFLTDKRGEKDAFKVIVRYYPATTTPGSYYLKHPMNPKGSAILPLGEHSDLWRKGYHRGRYPALVQDRATDLYRDNNKDILVDYENYTKHKKAVGINLHRASRWWITRNIEKLTNLNIDRWSAGCQVIASKKHFDYLMWFVNQSINHLYSYTLISDYDKTLNLNDYGEDK